MAAILSFSLGNQGATTFYYHRGRIRALRSDYWQNPGIRMYLTRDWGIEDHIHLVVSIPPKISIAEFVKGVKGSSAYHLSHNLTTPLPRFSWQRGYGIFSLDSKQIDTAVAYVRNQKTHHRQGGLILALEQDNDEDNGPVAWKRGEALVGINIIKSSLHPDD